MPWDLINLAISFVAFGMLARLAPCNPGQRLFVGRDMAIDALYGLLGVVIYGDIADFYIRTGASLMLQKDAPAALAMIFAGYGPVSHLPLIVQSLLMLVVLDFVQYWLHRLFHLSPFWPFHAVHHSPEDLDWTATYRIHPVNFLIYSAGALAIVRLAGFSPAAFFVLGPFNLVIGSLVHANLNWTFGPFRYVIASPVFHRWHHVSDPAVHDKNFSPTFPVWDLMFGTFHMPRGELPQAYGVEGMPKEFLAQLVYPFRVTAERLMAARKPRVGAATA
ncbi:MAG TPA: sterol desaturase family protein [Caulobacteraceae bacterium]|jgi:sterol desaturase/sphingolipid hydroxylase (fatty acid hydroxylase superfamily)